MGGEKVRALHLVQMGQHGMMLVVVTDRGRVLQQHFRSEVPIEHDELVRAERLVVNSMVGKDLANSLEADLFASEPDAVRQIGEQVVSELARTAAAGSEVYVGGTRQMAEAWDNLSSIHRVLEVLEVEAEVLQLLANVSGLSIRIGSELPVSDDVDLAVVSATYEAGGSAGSLGVIGPMRMNYKKAISAVERVGRELEDRIGS
jgi:heat-inducible transcriptional repressor